MGFLSFTFVFLSFWLDMLWLSLFRSVWDCGIDYSSKYFFKKKYIKIIFFIFKKKIIFEISTSKRSENIKKN